MDRVILALRRFIFLALFFALCVAAMPGYALAYGDAPTVKYYVVKPGDTLSRIAGKFGTSLAEIERLNHFRNPNMIYVGQRIKVPSSASPVGGLNSASASVGRYDVYVVKPGDTLYMVAVRFHTTILEIMRINALRSTLIFVGQKLKVPGGSTPSTKAVKAIPRHYGKYKVQPGDTLYGIAMRFHISVARLKQLNPWVIRRVWLLPGDELKVPPIGGSSIATPAIPQASRPPRPPIYSP